MGAVNYKTSDYITLAIEPYECDNMERFNISPTYHHIWHTADEIRAVAREGVRVYLDVGRRYPRIPCCVAAIVNGYVTAVSDKGGIYQDWAGCFHGTPGEVV